MSDAASVSLLVRPPNAAPFPRELGPEGVVVGRSSECGLRISDDSLSRRHCRLGIEAGRAFVEDLGSRNGTYVNDEVVKERQSLRAGDRVLAGGTLIEVRSNAAVSWGTDPAVELRDATAVFDVTSLSSGSRAPGIFPDLRAENHALALLSRAGAELISHRPLREVLDTVLDLALEGLDAERAAVVLLPGDASGAMPEPKLAAARGREGSIDLRVSRTVARAVVEQRRAVAVTDVEGDPRIAVADSVRLQGVRSLMCAPLWDGTRVQGLFYVDRRIGRGGYSETDLKVLSMLSNVVAVKIENARLVEVALEAKRLEEELGVARRIQERLLPATEPAARNLRVHGACLSCHEIGGDFYDWVALPGGRIGLMVADVCGKGVAGALLAASVQSALRGGRALPATPAERLAWLNAFVVEHAATERYITAAWVELDSATGVLEHSLAGHPPPVIVPLKGAPRRLSEGGIPLGLFPEAAYEQGRDVLEPGEKLVLFTDGIIEASPGGDRSRPFGVERLAEVVAAAASDPEEACNAVLGALEEHAGGAALRDDATLLVAMRSAP
jgi:sigma-B regulation protein RsbU (phosphoserine phosphatase)